MRDFRVVQGGKDNPTTEPNSPSSLQLADDMQFGPPPSLLVGTITALFGAGAGIASLLLFFTIWQPESHISQQWLMFVLAGAILGFFLRLERPLEQARDLMRSRVPD